MKYTIVYEDDDCYTYTSVFDEVKQVYNWISYNKKNWRQWKVYNENLVLIDEGKNIRD